MSDNSTRSALIGKLYRLEAAHQLPNHAGKCQRLHGHSYQVELTLSGPVRPADGTSAEGMVCDFGEVSQAWKQLHDQLDHQYLNDVIPADYQPTTAENLARYLLHRLQADLPALVAVKVWETSTGWAQVVA